MSNTDWIHCNRCFAIFDNELKMYIVSCFHILCRNCMKHSANGTKCPVCAKPIKFKEIGANMDANLKGFFGRETADTLEMPYRIIMFQKKQREHMVKFINNMLEKNQKLDQLRAEVHAKFQAKRTDYEKLRDQRRMMQQKFRMLHACHDKTPVKHSVPFFASPRSTNELSFERAFTANGSGSSRGFVFAPQPTPQPKLDFFTSPFSARTHSSGYSSQHT